MDPKAMVVLGNQQESPKEAHLWVCSGENIGRRFALDQPEHLIGRTATVDIPVIDERVSQTHAKVVLQDGRHFVEDLGSTNGTFVNNQPLTGPRKLQDGDLIQVGETVFEYISYSERNLTITVRGTSKDNDAVPANLRAGAKEALNRARQDPTPAPGAGTGQGYQPGGGTTVDVSAEPVPVTHLQRPSQGMGGGSYPPYMMGTYEDRRGVFLDEDDDDEDEEGGLDVQEIIRKVRMVILFFLPYWKVILALGIVFAVLGAFSVRLTPPVRKAVFEVSLVPSLSSNPLGNFSGNVAFFKSAEQNFRSSAQVARTLNELGSDDISARVVAAIQGDLTFESVGPPQPNTYRGSFTDGNGEYAVKFLETHVKLFLESEIEKTLRVMKGETEFLAEQLAETENELRRTEAELLEFKKDNIDGLPARAQQNYNLLFNLQQEKSRVELALTRARAQQKISEEQMRIESPIIDVETTLSDPYRAVITTKRQQLVEAEAAGKGPLHPDVQRLQSELKRLEELSLKAKTEASKTVTARNPTYVRIADQLRQYQLSETVAVKELAKIDRRLKKVRGVVRAPSGARGAPRGAHAVLWRGAREVQADLRPAEHGQDSARAGARVGRGQVRHHYCTEPRVPRHEQEDGPARRARHGGWHLLRLAPRRVPPASQPPRGDDGPDRPRRRRRPARQARLTASQGTGRPLAAQAAGAAG